MRYVVIFSDRTSRRVSEEQAEIFRGAMREKGIVNFKGSTYAGYSIIAIKPIHVHEQEIREEAQEAGLYRCRYGRTHSNRSECACKDAGFEKILNADEEKNLLEMRDNKDLGLPSPQQQVDQANARFLGIDDKRLLEERGD